MPYIEVETEVWVDLDTFETDELVEEVENRGYVVIKDYADTHVSSPLQRLYELKRVNDPSFDKEFADFIYTSIGKVL